MSVVQARVVIEGTRLMLWHHFGPEAIPLEPKPRSGKAGNDPDEWRKTVLKTADGQLYIEPSYIFGCLRAGAKHTPRKRGTMQSAVGATLEVLEDQILIDRWLPQQDLKELKQAKDEPVYLDVRTVRNPVTGSRNVRYRVAASPGWKASFTLTWDNSLVSLNEMHSILRDAGAFVGLGDARAIGCGRFRINSFEEIAGKQKDAEKQATARNLDKNTKKSLAARRR